MTHKDAEQLRRERLREIARRVIQDHRKSKRSRSKEQPSQHPQDGDTN